MYTSYIGKKFLKHYNHREKTNFTAKEFFMQEFFDLFFTDHSHLMHVSNSPFHYKPGQGAVEMYGSKSLAQLNELKTSIESNIVYMGNYVGGPAMDMDNTTSGQITNMTGILQEEDIYASWIGAALGIGVNGSFVMLIDEEELLWMLFEGWECYRKYLHQTPGLKDKQIETWNGNWICLRLENPNAADDLLPIEPVEVLGKLAIPTESWAKVTFMLAKYFSQKQILTAYAYNLSQTNTTLGFVNIFLYEVNRMFEWRENTFLGEDIILQENQITRLQTYYNLKTACKMGAIGLKALEPKYLREFMPKPIGGGKDFVYSANTANDFQIFKIWLIAMLNKIELLNLADEVAAALKEFAKSDKKGRSIKDQLSKEIRESRSPLQFIDNLRELQDEVPILADTLSIVMKEALTMPRDHFPLFLCLIRFQYSYRSAKN
ncbi:hypothetical protein [Chitinophaga sp. HK235]|uniref:hypothetical protein n=1 Tax=Chitinophaga sp. HK235 TaxID=2952571 RepID=UPI001BA98BB8|nr:hypothetical protein [Chitinophaga sp. HK235]